MSIENLFLWEILKQVQDDENRSVLDTKDYRLPFELTILRQAQHVCAPGHGAR